MNATNRAYKTVKCKDSVVEDSQSIENTKVEQNPTILSTMRVAEMGALDLLEDTNTPITNEGNRSREKLGLWFRMPGKPMEAAGNLRKISNRWTSAAHI